MDGAGGIGARLRQFASRQVRRLERLATEPRYRSVQFLRFFRNGAVHQWASTTALDRYPDVFERCARELSDRHDLRILSFGCSTGEEVITLRRYFPDAYLIGVDVNRHSLSVCRKRPERDERMEFLFADHRTIREKGPYDAVFCMAVLQRPQNRQPGRRRAVRGYSFTRFEAQIAALDAVVKSGGLFVVDHADYRFVDAHAARQYRAVAAGVRRARPVFDQRGYRVSDETCEPRVFVKSGRNRSA